MIASVAHIVNADWKNFVQDLADMEVLPVTVDRMSIAMVSIVALQRWGSISEVVIYVDLVLNIFMQELEEVLGDTVPQQGIPDIKFSKVSRVCDHYFMSEIYEF